MFLYHFLFFFFGIFGTLVILLLEGYQFTKNLAFIGSHLNLVIPQYLIHTVFCFYCFIAYNYPTISVTSYEIYFLSFSLLIRCFIISVRYGFISNTRYRLYKSKAKLNWVIEDFLLYGWLKISPKTLKEQIDASKFREQVYDEEWDFAFVECLPEDLHQRLSQQNYYHRKKYDEKDIKDKIKAQRKVFRNRKLEGSSFEEDLHFIHKESKKNIELKVANKEETKVAVKPIITKDQESNCTEKYKVEPVLREISLLESTCSGDSNYFYCIILARIILQLCCQYVQSGNSFVFFWYEYLLTLSFMFSVFFIYGTNFLFVTSGLIDFNRKLFFMKILQSLISPNKDKLFVFSTYFPTINSCCRQNLKAWLQLRSVCLDLGKKYTFRIFLYCSVFLGIYFTYSIFLLLVTIRVVKYQLPIAAFVTGIFDTLVVLAILFQMLRIGAKVNDYYDIHKGELIKIKKVLYEAKNNLDRFINFEESKYQSTKAYGEMLISLLKINNFEPKAIDDSLFFIDMAIQNLEYDKETKPLKLMGLTCSNELITSIYTGLASASFAISQILWSQYTS